MIHTRSPRRIAMWSGPRNLSTALMRAFSSRSDCVVSDEPFYSCYLQHSGLEHPMREEVIASQSSEWRVVAGQLSEEGPPLLCALWYQKHMAHHMRPEMLGPWLEKFGHAFLIRHPARVIASYLRVYPHMTLQETGLPWQEKLFTLLRQLGHTPPVIDAAQIRAAPDVALAALCAGLEIPWDPAMLRWKAGVHPQDGVWGRHWYGSIWSSTGFSAEPSPEDEPERPKVPFYDEALAVYESLRRHCLPV